MIERIGTAVTAQPETVKSVKASQNAKIEAAAEKEQTTAKTNDIRKRDRFERSSETSRTGSPDVPQTQKSYGEIQNSAQASNPRNYDRLELSGGYISEQSEKADSGLNTGNISESYVSAANPYDVSDTGEETSSQDVSYDSSSEDVDTNKLYQYTDTELKDFLIDGSITQSEYDREIAKREF